MTTNMIKKGMRFQLRNGWEATMMDNRKGNIRLAEVEGVVTETGSVYAHDIIAVRCFDYWQPVEHTGQLTKCRDLNSALFGG